MNTITLPSCPVCGRSSLRGQNPPGRWVTEGAFSPIKDQLSLSRCSACGFVFTNPRPDDSTLEEFYSHGTYKRHDTHGPYSTRRGGHLLPLLGEPGRLLDYRCGAGGLLAEAAAAGWQVTGYEPDGQRREASRNRSFTVVSDLRELSGQRFDVVTAVRVLEHVTDLRKTLDDLRGLLTPSGRLCLEVPNSQSLRASLSVWSSKFDERYRAFPVHLSYFSPSTLRRLLKSLGWSIDRMTTAGMGLEELRARRISRYSASGHNMVANLKPRRQRKSRLRRFIRSLFFGLLWGENLVVVCHPNQDIGTPSSHV